MAVTVFVLGTNSLALAKKDEKRENHSIIDYYYIYKNKEEESVIKTFDGETFVLDSVGNIKSKIDIPYENTKERFEFELKGYIIKYYTNGLYLSEEERKEEIGYIKEFEELLDNDKWKEISYTDVIEKHILLDEKLVEYMKKEENEKGSGYNKEYIKLLNTNIEQLNDVVLNESLNDLNNHKQATHLTTSAEVSENSNEDSFNWKYYVFALVLILLLYLKVKIQIRRDRKKN